MNQKKFLLSLCTFTLSILAASATTSPVAFYRADGNGNDASGNTHHASVPVVDVNNPGLNYTTGKLGQAFRFGSDVSTYVDFGNWFDYQSFTLAMWILDDSTVNAPQNDFASVLFYSSNADFLWSLSWNATDQKYEWDVDGAGALEFSMTRGAWHYLAITRDASTGVSNVYIDGQLAGTTGTVPWSLNYDFANKIRMGANFQLNNYWHGAIDEFRVYDRALTAAEITLLSSSSAVDLVVPGAADPYLAGNSTAGCGDASANGQGPVQVTGLNLPAGATLTFAAAGSVSHGGGGPTSPVDGVSMWGKTAENGIAGAVYPLDTLVGVFLDDTDPNTTPIPDSLDFSGTGNVSGGTDYTSLSPALKQVFFIGDGSTSSGAVQQIVVPTGATRLFLGTTDGCGWYDNTGSFSVRVKSSAGTAGLVCPTGQIDCGGACVNLQTDPQNCGTCGHNCPTGWTCSAGGCVAPGQMSIFATISTPSDTSHGYAVHYGEGLEFTFHFSNVGTVTAKNLTVETAVPVYKDSNNFEHQFLASDIAMSPGSTFVPESSPGAKDAKIVWNVGDLDPGFGNFVRFTITVTTKVKENSAITLARNQYFIHGDNASLVEGPNPGGSVSSQVRGTLAMTVAANGTNVAPGANFSYTLTLKNLGSTTANHAVATFVQPEFARFISASFSNAPAKKKKKGFAPTAKLLYVQGQTDPQVVMDVGPLTANQTVTITLTFQAQWAEPSDVPKLSTTDYSAAFLTDTAYVTFQSNFATASSDPYAPGVINFFNFIGTPANITALSWNDSGIVDLTLNGSTADAPWLHLGKVVSNTASKLFTDANGHKVNGVQPGEQLTFELIAANWGDSQADEVYLQDRMPDHATFVSATVMSAVDFTALFTTKKKKTVAPTPPNVGTLRVIPDSDGHHLRFAGFTLPPHVGFVMTYTVQIDSGGNAPAAGTFINADNVDGTPPLSVSSIGSASSPHTPEGFYADNAIQVVGQSRFGEPRVRRLAPNVQVTTDKNATANTLNSLYASNASARPLTNPAVLDSYIPGVERFYIHYETIGNVATNNVALDFPLPAHTAFYRAAFMTLPPNNANGQDGYMPGTVTSPVPAGFGISAPSFLATAGTVTFTFNSLAPNTSGDAMVEVIVDQSAIAESGSAIGGPDALKASIHDATTQKDAPIPLVTVHGAIPQGSTIAQRNVSGRRISTPTNVPQYGIAKIAPREVKAGDTFKILLTAYNFGDTANQAATVNFKVPANAEIVSADAGQSNIDISNASSDGSTFVTATLATANGPITLENFDTAMQPRTGAGVTITLRATGPAGSSIIDDSSSVAATYMETVYATPSTTTIYTPNPLAGPTNGSFMSATGVPLNHFIFNGGDVAIIDLGGGNIVAQGAGNIVAQGAGNIVAQGAGNIVAQGAGNLIPIGSTNGATLLAHASEIVAQGAGNIVAQGAGNIVAQGAGNIVAAGAGNIVAQGAGNLVAQGGGNIVAQGAGNAVNPAIASLIGAGANQLVAQGGGNIVAQGAGNLVAQGGGNIVAAGAGNIVAQGAGNILSSLADSSAAINTRSGNIVAAGAGNIVAQGAGN